MLAKNKNFRVGNITNCLILFFQLFLFRSVTQRRYSGWRAFLIRRVFWLPCDKWVLENWSRARGGRIISICFRPRKSGQISWPVCYDNGVGVELKRAFLSLSPLLCQTLSVGATRMELQTVLLVDLIGYPRLYLAGPHSNYDHARDGLQGIRQEFHLKRI